MGMNGNSDAVSPWSHPIEREEAPDWNRGEGFGLTGVSYANGVEPWGRYLRGGRCSGRLTTTGGGVNGGSECPR
jgi:hypothetical protein